MPEFEYKKYFDAYCKETGLALQLSFEMPAGYEMANGAFDPVCKIVFLNAERLKRAADEEKAAISFAGNRCFFLSRQLLLTKRPEPDRPVGHDRCHVREHHDAGQHVRTHRLCH